MAPNLRNWIPMEQAAALLGKSRRTLEREIADRSPDAPETAARPRDGKRPETVCNPRDIERLTARKPKVIPTGSKLLPSPAPPLAIPGKPSAEFQALAGLVQHLVETVERMAEQQQETTRRMLEPPAAPPRYITGLRKAAEYTGLSEAMLRRLMRGKKLLYVDDWDSVDGHGQKVIRFSRADLDSLDIEKLTRWLEELKETAGELRQAVQSRKAAE